MTSTRRNSRLAFILGFGVSFLPSFAPFAGILFVLTTRLRLRAADVPWLLAAVLSAVAVGVHGGLGGVAFGFLQVFGPWAVLRAFADIRQPPLDSLPRGRLLQGLVAGFAVFVLVGLTQMLVHHLDPSVRQPLPWGPDPVLFAGMVLALGTLVALLAEQPWVRLSTVAVAAVGIVASGTWEAGIGLALVIAFLTVRALVRQRVAQGAALGTIAVTVAVLASVISGPSSVPGLAAPAASAGRLSASGLSDHASTVAPPRAATALPTPSGDASGTAASPPDRRALWSAAVDGFRQRPWFGWGTAAFPEYYRGATGADRAAGAPLPKQAHDLYLAVAFERGAVGLAALLLLLAGLAWPAVRRRDVGFLVVLVAVLLANVFDYTFFFGGVIYPLAAAAGFRSGVRTVEPAAADSVSRRFVVRLVLAAADLSMAWLAFVLSRWLVPALGLGAGAGGHLALARYALFLWPVMAWREGLYPGYGLAEPDELRRQTWGSLSAGIIFLAGSVFFGKDLGVAPALVVGTTLLSLALLPMGRAAMKRALRALGVWGRPVVILGNARAAGNIARTLAHRTLDGLRPVAVFGERPPGRSREAADADPVPYTGPVSGANTFARREGIHHAIVAMDPGAGQPRMPRLDPAIDAFTIVQYVPDLPGLPVLGVRASSLDNFLALEVRNELASPVNRFIKRGIDLVAVVAGGLLISPVLLAIAVAVRTDSRGPLFFAHERIGRGGRTFRVWKFRTMADDAEAALERHLADDPALRAEWEANHKLKDDPRITRVGRFLRRFSLDELPQLWNVLRGEMSLVGPRPIVAAEVPKYAETFDLYSMVRPGMTGYWQISGRSDTDYDQRVELDSFYVRNWSVWLDIVVLLKTVSVVLKRDGAY